MKRVVLVPNAQVDLEWLASQLAASDVIVPLSLTALARLQQISPNVAALESFVPDAEMRALADRAEIFTNEFARAACDGEALNGYDIPQLAWQAQEHFFRDALLAIHLAQAWNDTNISQLTWAGTRGVKSAFYLPTYDTSLQFLEHAFHGTLEFLVPPTWHDPSASSLVDKVKKTPGVLARHYNDHFRKPARARVVAAFTEREWSRHSLPLTGLAQEYESAFQFWSLGQPSPKLREWANARNIAVKWVSYSGRIENDLRAFFEKQWQAWQTTRKRAFAQASGLDLIATDKLDFHFRFFFLTLFPRLAQWARKMERWLHLAQPEWVIASSDYVAAYALPHHTAARLRIPSVALPHTFVPQGNHPLTASFLALRNHFERMNYADSFPDDARVWLCRDASNALSYAPQTPDAPFPQGKKIIAILTVGEDTYGAFMSKVNRAEFLETLRALMCPPPELDDLHFVIKAHPRFDVAPLLQTMNTTPRANVTILDANFSVTQLIERAWVIVQCNYFGSTLMPALESGKPVLFLDTAGHYWPGESRVALGAGTRFETMRSFWDFLHDMQKTVHLYASAARKAREFHTEWLSEPAYTLLEQIGRHGSKRVNARNLSNGLVNA